MGFREGGSEVRGSSGGAEWGIRVMVGGSERVLGVLVWMEFCERCVFCLGMMVCRSWLGVGCGIAVLLRGLGRLGVIRARVLVWGDGRGGNLATSRGDGYPD